MYVCIYNNTCIKNIFLSEDYQLLFNVVCCYNQNNLNN